jgi:aminopeptidase N
MKIARPAAAIVNRRNFRLLAPLLAVLLALAPFLRADQPYAPDREYDLMHARIELRFDVDQRRVMGQVTHTLAALRDGLRQLDFDSVDLKIQAVQVDGKDARFSTDAQKLHVDLAAASKAGQKYDVSIRYDGQPKKGLFFILPDKSRPKQTKQIWSQGEAEDTRNYIPIYDYPNDRTTFDMILTVPADWQTVSNGKLISVTPAAQGMKTWTWSQTEPVSTYLISLVVGEFDKRSDMWRNIPVDYMVPRGDGDRIPVTFARTPDMLTFFSQRLGVDYPWDKYDQSMVDQFVVGGMENVSATTLTVRNLLDPQLAKESLQGADGLISHEMGHQWFGDLVTTKDWGNLWLNEGFATFMATLWQEHQYGADNAAYSRWRSQANWARQRRLYNVPIVTRSFDDSLEYAGNIYDKGGLVLQMLREQLGDEAFFAGLKHYLEKNRLGNVVTEDLVRAMEESTGASLQRFFDQWVYGAGAPRFAVTSAYDPGGRLLNVTVKQTQRVAGSVGLFTTPLELVLATPKGNQTVSITASKPEETFAFTMDGPPLNVIFDKGSRVLKTVDFKKKPEEWVYQLQHAEDAVDRAIAAEALGDVKDNPAVIAALGGAAQSDAFWGVRVQALTALGRLRGGEAAKQVQSALTISDPWVRDVAVEQLGRFKDESGLPNRLAEIAQHDPAYRVRTAALLAYAQLRPRGGLSVLQSTAKTDSPDDVIRRAALRAMGSLGDDKAVDTLLDWSEIGKPTGLRSAALGSLAQLDKKNQNIEKRLEAMLDDPVFDIRAAAVSALGQRDDSSAIPTLEAMRRRSDLPVNFSNIIDRALDQLKHTNDNGERRAQADGDASGGDTDVAQRLSRVEQTLTEVNDRLKRIEDALPSKAGAN